MINLLLFGILLSSRIKDSINGKKAKMNPYRYIVPEIATGFCTASIIGTGSAYITKAISNCSKKSGEMIPCVGQIIGGFLAGYVLGAPLGVYLVGRIVKLKGRFAAAFFGSLIGTGISIFFLSMAGNNLAMRTAAFAAFVSPPLISSIVYSVDSDRRRKSNKSAFNLNICPFSRISEFSEKNILNAGMEVVVSF